MSGFIRQIKLNDGTPITPPSSVNTSVASWEVFANDAAYEAVYGTGEQGDSYFNSTELLLRVHNGTEWVYLQNGINALEDSTSSGSNIDLDSTYHNLLKLTNAGVISCRSLDPGQTLICYLVNDTGSDISLLHDDAGATAANRILLPGSTAFTLTDGNVAHLVYDSIASRWRYTNTPGAGNGGGTGQGAKNYVLGPDDSSEVVTTGGVVASDTVTPSELPEETKGIGCKIVQTAGSATDTCTWNVDAIDDGDGNRIGVNQLYYKTLGTYADDDAKVFWTDTTTGDVFGEQNIKAGSGYISGDNLTMVAGNDITPVIEFNVANSDGLVVSGVGVLAQNPLVAGIATDFKDAQLTDSDFQGIGTATNIDIEYAQIGNHYFIAGKFTTGTTSASEFRMNLPNNATIGGFHTQDTPIGYISASTGTSQNRYNFVYTKGQTYLRLAFSANAAANGVTVQNGNILASTTDHRFEVGPIPLQDISGTTQFGSDLEAANARGSFQDTSGQSIPTATWTKLTFNTTINDSSGGLWSNNRFTATRSGFLDLSCYRLWASVMNSASTFMRITVNGVERKEHKQDSGSSSQEPIFISTSGIYLEAGEYVEVEAFHNEGANRLFTTTATENWIDFHWVSSKSSTLTGFPLSSQANANLQYLVPEYRETTITLDNQFTGGTLTVNVTRIGNSIIMTGEGIATHASLTTVTTNTSLVPTWAIPNANTSNCYFSDGAGANADVSLRVGTDGSIVCFYNTARTDTFFPINISYNI